jgi:hypothetical protein
MSVRLLSLITVLAIVISCNTKTEKADPRLLTDQNLMHRNMHQLTEVIINDMFSPPVSSRIYTYTSLAAYEALKFDKPGYSSIAAKLNGFAPMPVPEKNNRIIICWLPQKPSLRLPRKLPSLPIL